MLNGMNMSKFTWFLVSLATQNGPMRLVFEVATLTQGYVAAFCLACPLFHCMISIDVYGTMGMWNRNMIAQRTPVASMLTNGNPKNHHPHTTREPQLLKGKVGLIKHQGIGTIHANLTDLQNQRTSSESSCGQFSLQSPQTCLFGSLGPDLWDFMMFRNHRVISKPPKMYRRNRKFSFQYLWFQWFVNKMFQIENIKIKFRSSLVWRRRTLDVSCKGSDPFRVSRFTLQLSKSSLFLHIIKIQQ